MGAGRSAGWFKEGAGISACALKKETGGVLGRGSRLAVAGPGEVGKTAWPGGPGRSAKAGGSGERGRALCGREAPGWLTGGPDWGGASRGVGRTTRLGVGRCALGGQARAGGRASWAAVRWAAGCVKRGLGRAGCWAGSGGERVWAPFLNPFLSISFLF